MTVYPKPEIHLKDTTTLLSGEALFKDMIIEMTAIWKRRKVDIVLKIESTYVIIVLGIAHKLDIIFAHLRKSDNTPKPLNTLRVDYDLGYGLTEIHIHKK